MEPSAESPNSAKAARVAVKGAWSQIVRGGGASTTPTPEEAPTLAPDARKADPAASPEQQPQSSSPQAPAAAAAAVASPEASLTPAGGEASPPKKQAWKKPSTSPKNIPSGPAVMGAVSWPALGDTSELKSQPAPEASPDQAPTSPTESRTGGKKPVVSTEASSTAGGFERVSKLNGDSPKPTSGSGSGSGSRPYYQQGYQGNRRNTREPGRPNQNWNSQRSNYYNRGDNYSGGMHNRMGPRHYAPQATTAYVNVNPGFISPAGPAAGLYYVQTPGAAPIHGAAGYYGAPGMLVPVPDPSSVRQLLIKQIEYYFSIENLCRDIYLRSIMDHEGFIPVSTIASFNRVRSLTADTSMIIDAMRTSTLVEVQGDKLRRRNDWMNWILSAGSPRGATESEEPVAPADEISTTFSGRAGLSNGDLEPMKNSSKTPGGLRSTFQAMSVKESSTFSTDEELTASHSAGEDDDSDLNDYDMQRLLIVTQSSERKWLKGIPEDVANLINDGLCHYEQELRQEKPKASGDFANGAVEANGVVVLPDAHHPQQQRLFSRDANHLSRQFSGGSPPDPVGFLFDVTPPEINQSEFLKPGGSSSVGSLSNAKPFPCFQHPSHAIMEENGFKYQEYIHFYARCLAERKRLGIGRSEEMNKLFRFWCYFLRTNFNRSMYKTFRSLAEEDYQAGFSYGMECLFRFYSYGLELTFKQDVYQDFEHLTLETYRSGDLYGLENYWAFHFYREGQPLKKNPELDRLLREYRSLEDFQRSNMQQQRSEMLLNGKSGDPSSPDLQFGASSRPASIAPAPKTSTSASIVVS